MNTKELALQYVANYTLMEKLEAENAIIKKQLCESEFMEDTTEDGIKLTRVVTQKFTPNKTIEELELLYPDAVLVEEIPAKPASISKTINVDLLKANPAAHEYLTVSRTETVKVTKPKAK